MIDTTRPAVVAESTPEAVAARPAVSTPRVVKTKAPVTTARADAAPTVVVPLSEPQLHAKLKPVLNRGTQMEKAAEGFISAEEFATVAHAARNTNVPFVVLKHHIVMEGQTLAEALHDAKPDLDAKAEVARAESAAKSDLAEISDAIGE